MAGSLRFLQLFQRIHKFVGIQNGSLIDTRGVLFVVFNAQFLLTSIAFIGFEAKSMFDYGIEFFVLICITNSMIVYFLFIWRFENSKNFIENCEKFMAKSKDLFYMQTASIIYYYN